MSAPLLLASTTAAVTPSVAVPGEASPMLVDYDKVTGAVQLTYTPACDASDNNVYYGDLAGVSTYAYAGVTCSVGNTGSASFDPGLDSAFFLIVGNNGAEEGSYGIDSSGVERPEDGPTPLCDRPQNLGGVVCE
jgi:hypothetical protein